MSKQKFIIQGAEDNTPEVQRALEMSVYLLKQASALVRTVNTMNEPIEPAKDFDSDYKEWIPNHDEQLFINEVNTRAEEVGVEVVFIKSGGAVIPSKGF